MTEQPTRFPRFFVTAESPCPYLPGRTERKVFAELRGPDAQRMSEGLGRIGFRRSQNVVYRPSCDGCNACVSVRIVASQFQPSQSHRRLLKRNADLDVAACDAWATEEQFDLLRRYLKDRHPQGGMAGMDGYDFAEMIETSPVDTVVVGEVVCSKASLSGLGGSVQLRSRELSIPSSYGAAPYEPG